MFATLMYHLVDDSITGPMSVRRREFELQLGWLATSGLRLLTADDADSRLGGDDADDADAVLVTFDDGYLNTVTTALPLLRQYGIPAMMAVCGSYLYAGTTPANTPHPSRSFARVADVEQWLDSGHALAGHSFRHPKLTQLDAEQLREEIDLDRAAISAAFGLTPHSFCYPFGSSNGFVREMVGETYRNAFATDHGVRPEPGSRLAARRLQVRPEWSLEAFVTAVEQNLADFRDDAPARDERRDDESR